MKRIFLIFLCLTLLGTLCACRVRLIADPAQADTILPPFGSRVSVAASLCCQCA